MKLFERLCEVVTSALGLSKVSLWGQHNQYSIMGDEPPLSTHLDTPIANDAGLVSDTEPHIPVAHDAGLLNYMDTLTSSQESDAGPIFKPPNASPGFLCVYSAMKGWRHTGGIGARTQWLSHPIDAEHPMGGL
jgi:hypothetical protein